MDKSFYNDNRNLETYLNKGNTNTGALNKVRVISSNNITYAGRQLQNSNWVEPPFKIDYDLKVPEALKNKVNRAYLTFIQDCLQDLESTMALPIDEYVGALSKNVRSGQGQLRMTNGDVYKGGFKNGVRYGSGVCMFKSGALYRGEWRDDKPNGNGILYSGKNEIVEGRFDRG